ncbi:MAG TPA: LuxR C-terminal-related transcriptional regulator [Gaiellaceae bacterium]|nr:LuxR C-terminal-related transcriptional regulator [Gaiellaceae bacterium]
MTEPELAALRRAAAELARQDGRGVRRRALVRLAATLRCYAVSVYGGAAATEPFVAVVRPLPGRANLSLATLTPRERDVAALIARGKSNKQIATDLAISVATVKDHVHSILSKTALPTRAAVAAEWHRV